VVVASDNAKCVEGQTSDKLRGRGRLATRDFSSSEPQSSLPWLHMWNYICASPVSRIFSDRPAYDALCTLHDDARVCLRSQAERMTAVSSPHVEVLRLLYHAMPICWGRKFAKYYGRQKR
jgi:hypothetical protein